MPMKHDQGSPLWGSEAKPSRWRIPAMVAGGIVLWAVVFGIGYLIAGVLTQSARRHRQLRTKVGDQILQIVARVPAA